MKAPQTAPQGTTAPAKQTEVPSRSFVLGTAGHIDHGKTALVFALTGTDTDRLPEEKSRGITIDLGFASLSLPDPHGGHFDLSLIDVPGHHAFVRNMLAGAGGIDCVMLVVAADEGVKAQTREHLAICTLLGIRMGLVVLTKEDAVTPERLDAARGEVAELVRHTFLASAPVLAVSARTRKGIPELKRELAQLLTQIPERNADAVPRLPLDRAFSVRGFGTVVTGTLQAGVLRAGQLLELAPGRRGVRVRGVQVHGQARAEAPAPNRVAVNLVGLEVADVQRGDTLVPPDTLQAVHTVDAEIAMLPGVPALRHRSGVRVHAFAADTLATVLVFGPAASPTDTPGEATLLVRLRLAKPLLVVPGDRFVVRQPSPAMTIAGGRVLDVQPPERVRKAAAYAWLQRLREATVADQLLLRVERHGVAGTTVRELVRETGLTADALRRLLAPLRHGGKLIATAQLGEAVEPLLATESLRLCTELVLKELQRTGGDAMARAKLRSRTQLTDWVLELALERLQADKRIKLQGDLISILSPSQPAAPARHPRLEQVEAVYRQAGLASPILSEIATTLRLPLRDLPPLITVLLREKRLVRMGADNLFIHAAALEQLAANLRAHRGESFDVARFKDFTRLTRKHAIPLLEYLDGARITRNNKGTRIVL